jgi:hypothetical protein
MRLRAADDDCQPAGGGLGRSVESAVVGGGVEPVE